MSETVLKTNEEIPPELKTLELEGWKVEIAKSTYEANNPSEDRSTVVIDPDNKYIFAGVWDGHGGTKASDFVEGSIWPEFKKVLGETRDIEEAFKQSYRTVDEEYIRTGREMQDPSMLLTGTCAVGAYVDMERRQVTVGNLGDSRAVCGVYEDDYVTAMPMSSDHSATEDAEKFRLRAEHPTDPDIIIEQFDEWKEDYDCVVKGVTRFTRSIGDAHMKDKTCAKLFNSYRCGVSVEPIPRKVPYISSTAETKMASVENGFIIIACDGIWDEMSSDEAIHLCHHLIIKYDGQPDINLADEFLNETLKKSVLRLRRTDPDEEEITLEELKRRPLGKQGRSQLHDDLTCVILRWTSTAGMSMKAKFGGASGWKQIKRAVDMHSQIKHRKRLKWAKLMEDLMVVIRQEREGRPSVLTTRILSGADDEDDEDDAEEASASVGAKLLAGGGSDFTQAVALAAKAAEDAAKAATSADLAGRTGDPEVMKAAAVAANAAAGAANQASAAAAAAAAAATSAARACEIMARACGVDVSMASSENLEEAKD